MLKSQTLHMLDLRSKVAELDDRIAEIVRGESLAHFVEAFGPTTTAAIFADAGDPSRFSSSGALQKALGLN